MTTTSRLSQQRSESLAACVVAFRRIVRLLRLTSQQTQQVSGISAAQMFVLHELRDGPPLSLNDLAARTFTDRTSVAEIVERLQARRLVRRETATSDRRRAEITLTPAGRDMLRKSPRNIAPLLPALDALSTAELNQLSRALAHLTRAMGVDEGRALFPFEDESRPKSKRTRR